jgi:hypothetical protein
VMWSRGAKIAFVHQSVGISKPLKSGQIAESATDSSQMSVVINC